jgi:hypothetical protein
LCCQNRWLKQLEKKYKDLIFLHSLYKKNINLEMLAELESGKIKISGDIRKINVNR